MGNVEKYVCPLVDLQMYISNNKRSEKSSSKKNYKTSLVVQWLGIHLPMPMGFIPGMGGSHMP